MVREMPFIPFKSCPQSGSVTYVKKSCKPLLTVPCIGPIIFIPLIFRSEAKSQVMFLAKPGFREPLAEVYCPTA